MAKTKKCSRCKKVKSWNEYTMRTDRRYPKSECRECERIRGREYYHRNPQISKKRHLKNKFNLTTDDYNKLFKAQKGYCAICGKHQSELARALAVDHNHLTGKIRGLLCSKCNPAIGALGADNGTELLQKAIEYVEKYDE